MMKLAQRLKQKRILYMMGMAILLVMVFQNCGPSAPQNSSDELSSEDSGLSTELERLKLEIRNMSYCFQDSETAVDIGGFCTRGSYAQTRILYAVRKENSNATLAWKNPQVTCGELGRFQVRVELPQDSDRMTSNYEVWLNLQGLGSDGKVKVDNLKANEGKIVVRGGQKVPDCKPLTTSTATTGT